VNDWVTVGAAADIPHGHAALVDVDGTPVAVFNVNGQFYAVDDTCSHAEASLSEGELDPEACSIECPMHGSCFDLRTGEPLSLPAYDPVRVHRVEVVDGTLRVAVDEGALP
jgi:3-phenylpropionate/trans-cinnamate dioxygenase ferredoxin component